MPVERPLLSTDRRPLCLRSPRAPLVLLVVAFALAPAPRVVAEGDAPLDADAINARIHRQLAPPTGSGRIQTVAGEMYIAREDLDADVIGEALAAMLAARQGDATTVAVERAARINFEIHFPKNSAELKEDARASLDALAEALQRDEVARMRFVLGGHTDQDGGEAVNGPLSQVRAEAARTYLVERHAIPPDRLVARGYGAAEPLHPVERSETEKRYNRRVDLRPLR